MKPKEQVFDDIARVAGGAVGLFSGLTQQVRSEIRARVDELATRMDLVPREDFERLEAMLAESRKQLAALTARIEKLEKTRPGETAQKKTDPKKAGPKKTGNGTKGRKAK